VTTELGTGTSEINRDGETGLVVPPSDVGALAGAIARLLADEPLRSRMAAAAAKRARDAYSIGAMTDRLLDCYKFAMGKPQGA
jgi:glycosyltransferase involved in cell wall biosynthesis